MTRPAVAVARRRRCGRRDTLPLRAGARDFAGLTGGDRGPAHASAGSMAIAGVTHASTVLSLAIALGSGGCFATDANMKPALMPNLRELPSDSERRNEYIESTKVRAPENKKPLTGKARQVETAAATAAAVLGIFFSKTSNVLIGPGMSFGGSAVVRMPGDRDADGDGADDDLPPPDEVDAGQLVPWVKLPASGTAPTEPAPSE